MDVRDRGVLRSIAVAGACVLLSGCQSPSPGDVETAGDNELVASSTPYFSDVPVPAGFHLIDEETSDYMTSGLRYARHVYEGRSDPVAVRAFFHRQMPMNRWNWVDTQNESGVQLLRFQKGQERCDITVMRETKGWSRKTIIRIRISPARSPRPAQPKERT